MQATWDEADPGIRRAAELLMDQTDLGRSSALDLAHEIGKVLWTSPPSELSQSFATAEEFGDAVRKALENAR